MEMDLDYVDTLIAEIEIETEKEKEEDKRQRRLQRIKDCGKYAWWFDPHTGQKSGYIRYCENFRECPVCLERRAKQEYEWMKLKIYQEEIQIMVKRVPNKKEGNKLTRGISKDQYLRYPQNDGTEILFFDALTGIDGGEPVDENWIRDNAHNWEDWVLTPEGRNKSGTLHMPSQPDNQEKTTVITTKQFITDAPEAVVSPIMDRIVEETKHMNPKTPEEVEECLEMRFMRATAEIAQLGFNLSVYEKKFRLIHSKINWQNSRLINLIVNTENLTRKIPDSIPK